MTALTNTHERALRGRVSSPARRPFGLRPSVVPGFGITLGLTLTWLALIVLIPLGGLFLKTATLSPEQFWAILSNRRRVKPFGLGGGGSALPGRNTILRTDGTTQVLTATAVAEMREGDVFVIETPGGGAFGTPEPD